MSHAKWRAINSCDKKVFISNRRCTVQNGRWPPETICRSETGFNCLHAHKQFIQIDNASIFTIRNSAARVEFRPYISSQRTYQIDCLSISWPLRTYVYAYRRKYARTSCITFCGSNCQYAEVICYASPNPTSPLHQCQNHPWYSPPFVSSILPYES